MRLSDLLAASVVDADGTPLGQVNDVRLAQTGRPHQTMAELQVESLLVSPRSTGSLFGYDRRAEQGPLLLRKIIRFLHRRAFIIDWNDIRDWDPQTRRITLPPGVTRQPCRPA